MLIDIKRVFLIFLPWLRKSFSSQRKRVLTSVIKWLFLVNFIVQFAFVVSEGIVLVCQNFFIFDGKIWKFGSPSISSNQRLGVVHVNSLIVRHFDFVHIFFERLFTEIEFIFGIILLVFWVFLGKNIRIVVLNFLLQRTRKLKRIFTFIFFLVIFLHFERILVLFRKNEHVFFILESQ